MFVFSNIFFIKLPQATPPWMSRPASQDVEAGCEAAGDGDVDNLDEAGLLMIHNP